MDFRSRRIVSDLPLATIGVLSYNYSQYIEAALNSLLSQTYPFIELIIIDDCSTEKSTSDKIRNWIASNNVHCTFLQNEINLGITRVSNMLVSMAKGKYIDLFATDDIMLPEKIERQVKILEEAGEEYGMCYANVLTIDEAGNELGLYDKERRSLDGDVLEAYVFKSLSFCTPSALIRTKVYKDAGAYDERVLLEDYNFWLRVFALYKAKYCDYPCLKYRVRQQSELYGRWIKNNNERYYHDRILSNFQALGFTDNKKVRTYLKRKIAQYLKALSAEGSIYFPILLKYLLFKGYYDLPVKTFASNFIRRTLKRTAI